MKVLSRRYRRALAIAAMATLASILAGGVIWLPLHGSLAPPTGLPSGPMDVAVESALDAALGRLAVVSLGIGLVAFAIASLAPGGRRRGHGSASLAAGAPGEDDLPRTIVSEAPYGSRELRVSRHFLDQVLRSVQDAVIVTAPTGLVREVNEAAVRLLGYTARELVGQSLPVLLADDSPPLFDSPAHARAKGRVKLRARRGESVPIEFTSSRVSHGEEGWIFVCRSLADHHRSRRRIRYLARYDSLTRVANRMQFQHRLQQALARSRRNDTGLVLMYLDLDRFKDVNDTFGHLIGDRCLEITARRLVDVLEAETVVGRLAGDEFAVIVDGLPPRRDTQPSLAASARMLLDEIAREIHVEKRSIRLTASIGMASYPDDGDNVVDLIRNADAAMYHAKQSGGNTYGFYSPEMNADAVDRLMLKAELRRAQEREEFEVRYQPKLEVESGRIVGAEALLRWRHPKRGLVPPDRFIGLAEESDLIFSIGEWVLEQVCQDYARWQSRLPWPGRMAVNLSLRQLRQRDFVENIGEVLNRWKLSPSCFELEITESTLMDEGERSLTLLKRLYEEGLHLCIDDFGTGYSSLSALRRFPVGTLKIDRSFVEDALTEQDGAALVTTIITMGNTLNLDVVAEGVETQDQLTFLKSRGCNLVQGHLFGEPLTADEYLELMVDQEEGRARHAGLFA